MIGALGACFGRVVTMDSPKARAAGHVLVAGDAVARAGARHHAADVESARAALADRRDLGLRGRQGAPGVGPRDGSAVRDGAAAEGNAEAEGSERRLHAARNDRARLLPGVAARRSHRHDLRPGRAAPAAGGLRRGPRRRSGAGQGRSASSTDKLQASFDSRDQTSASPRCCAALRRAVERRCIAAARRRRTSRGSEGGGGCRSGQLRGAARARPRACRSGRCRGVRAARAGRGAGAGRDRRRQPATR